MPKWDAVGFGADNAEVEPDETYSTYDEATNGVPPKGVYRFVAKRLKADETGPNSANPGSPKVVMVLEINEPKGTNKAKFNGYGIWLHRPVDPEYASRVNQMLLALLGGTKLTDAKKKAVLKAFWNGTVVIDDEKFIKKIGTWNIPDAIDVAGSTREETYEGSKRLAISQLLSIADAPAPVAADEDEDDDAADEYEEEDDATDEEEEDDEEEPEDEESAEDARFDELMELGRAAMRPIAKELGIKVLKSMSDEDLANAIVDAEIAAGKFDAADEEPEDEEEEEPEEDEEDEEDEPEPPAPTSRRRAPSGRGAAKPAAKTRPAAKRRAADDDEPPF